MHTHKLQAFERLLTIMDELREKCPWDRKQTIDSLRHLTIEETYELSDAILQQDTEEIKKELGDVLLHIVFYAKIASETDRFDMAGVINTLCDKLIKRHPHIYSTTAGNDQLVEVNNEEDVKQNWEQLKLQENNHQKSLLSGVPASMPSLVKAYRMQEKAAQVGFDWPDAQQVWAKVEEELQEFKEAETAQHREEEFGDLLFSLVNYARFNNINPDDALERTNKKFKQRFEYIENNARAAGKKMNEMTLEEMDVYWNEAKNAGRK